MKDSSAKEPGYRCPECGLHYPTLETAEQCARWCSEHHSCNLEITRLALERQPGRH